MIPQPLISVIVPVYNVAAYLPRCLKSLLTQTYQNLEVLLVDDGSTDTSFSVCQTYAQKDARVVCIRQENKGVSAARNAGLEKAKGTFIMFVDPDDWLTKDACKKLILTQQQTNADIVLGNFFYCQDNQPPKPALSTKKGEGSIRPAEAFSLLFTCHCVVWAKLYKKSAIQHSRFDTQYTLGEDVDFLFRASPSLHRFAYVSTPIYCYYLHPNSAIWTQSIRARFSNFQIWKKVSDFYANNPTQEIYKKIEPSTLNCAILLTVTILLYDSQNQYSSVLAETQTFLHDHLKRVWTEPYRFAAKIFLSLFAMFPSLIRVLCKIPPIHNSLEKNFHFAITRHNTECSLSNN